MREDYRLFVCALCRTQVRICSFCDRGQQYCGKQCSYRARREAQRAAGQRYQRSLRGRMKHTERQRRYRIRQRKNHPVEKEVTHQGTPQAGSARKLVGMTDPSRIRDAKPVQHAVQCLFCGSWCRPYARLEPIRARRRYARFRQPGGERHDSQGA
jgi:hypothetical protein